VTGRLDGESYARAALTYLAEPGDLRLSALVRTYGAERSWTRSRRARFPGGIGCAAGGSADAARTAAAQRAMARWQVRLGEVPAPGNVAGFCSIPRRVMPDFPFVSP
jgi:hypothetical protein